MKKIVLIFLIIYVSIILYHFHNYENVILEQQLFLDIDHTNNFIYTINHEEYTTLCCLDNKKSLLFCIRYKNLPNKIKRCLLVDSPIIFYNFTSYKLCGNELLDMGRMEIIPYTENPYIYNLLKNVSANPIYFNARKIRINPPYNINTVYQNKLKICGFFTLLNIYSHFNETQKCNYVKYIISKNTNKIGVSIREIKEIISNLGDNYSEIYVYSFYDPKSATQRSILDKNTPIFVISRYVIGHYYQHSRLITGYDDKQRIIYVVDTANVYGFNPVGDIVFSYNFFDKLMDSKAYGLVLKVNS